MATRPSINKKLRRAIYERDGFRCWICTESVVLSKDVRTSDDYAQEATLDHIDPEGPSTFENLKTAHRVCNSRRGRGRSLDEVKFLDLNRGEFTRIHNALIRALARTKLNGEEVRIIFAIISKTYSFRKSEDWIANSQLEEMTGIHRTHCSRAVKRLIERKIVTKIGNKVKINKYFFQWVDGELLPKRATQTKLFTLSPGVDKGSLNRQPNVAQTGNSLLPKQATTKESITKESITKADTLLKKGENALRPIGEIISRIHP